MSFHDNTIAIILFEVSAKKMRIVWVISPIVFSPNPALGTSLSFRKDLK